jgi:hypothetical protein
MPRDGSGIYNKPFPDVVEGTTIESAVHNGEITDIALDLNSPRPIIAGGTGANNARDAMIALGGELTNQIVTNYDTFPFVDGSFHSAAGATSAPGPGYYTGICYTYNDGVSITIEVRELTGSPTGIGRKYVRQKSPGGWTAWALQASSVAELDAAYVNAAGDTMTGNLTVPALDVTSTFVTSGKGGANGTYYFGNSGTKYLAYDGANFSLNGGPLVVNNYVMSAITTNTGVYYFGNSGSKYLAYDGVNFLMLGGALSLGAAGTLTNFYAGDIYTSRGGTPTTGVVFFGNTQTKYLLYDANIYSFAGGGLSVGGTIDSATFIKAGSGYNCKSGTSGAYTGNLFNFQYSGSVETWINATYMGNITLTSDYRVKKDVIDLPSMWDTVKGLRPIKYTQAQFSPPSHLKYVAGEVANARKEAEENPEAKPREVDTGPMFKADDIERWGFIAHELQETLIPNAATGVKDSPDTIQSPNPWTVIAALTSALQEAMARIETLEGGAARRR